MPLALVLEYAAKLPQLPQAQAVGDVLTWAKADKPPADYVAPGSLYRHWANRWDATRATSPTSAPATPSADTGVPSYEETRRRYIERAQ